jgi:hypothetical protein
VFRSGTRDEFTVNAEIAGIDRDSDLAVLAVEHSHLPEAVDSNADVPIRETMGVLVLGFPFGEVLTTSGRHPAITVSKSSISSIRRNDEDRVALIQIDGGINPGNSGGPVVTEDGKLIGISVAKFRGAELGFAIPKPVLTAMLKGRISRTLVRELRRDSEQYTVRINVELIDPRQNIASVAAITFPTNCQVHDQPNEQGRWPLASDRFELTKLNISGMMATTTIIASTDPAATMFQIRWTRRGGEVLYTAPKLLRGHHSSTPAMDSAGQGLLSGKPQIGRERMSLPGVFTDVDAARRGELLIFSMQPLGKVAVVDVLNRRLVKVVDVGARILCAAGEEKMVLVDPLEKTLQRWDLDTLTLEKTVTLTLNTAPDVVAMGAASHGPVLIGGGRRRDAKLQLVCLATLDPIDIEVSSGAPQGRFSIGEGSRVRVSADGRLFAAWLPKQSPTGVCVLKVEGSRAVTYYQHSTAGYIAPNMDGTLLYTPRGIFTSQIKRVSDVQQLRDGLPVPAARGNCYLRLEPGSHQQPQKFDEFASISLHCTGQAAPILSIHGLSLRGAHYSDLFARDEIGIDQRIHFLPDANVLVTLPESNDAVVFHDLDIDAELHQSSADYLFVASHPSGRIAVGETFRYQTEAKSNRGDVVYQLTSGPPRMAISQEGLVTWTPDRGDAGAHNVVVAISDASGRTATHRFTILVSLAK